MENVIGPLVSLLPLALIIGVIVALVRGGRERSADGDDAGLGTVRRLFLYGIGLLALYLAGFGLSLLLGGALDAISGETVIAESDTQLAFALSFSIVGVPVWLLTAALAQRSVRAARAAEVGSEVRRWYLNLACGLALVLAAVGGLQAVRVTLGVEEFDGVPWGWLVVWSLVWLLHDWIRRAEAPVPQTNRIDHIYLALGSAFGLAFLLSGLGGAVSATMSAAYDALFRSNLVTTDWSEDLRSTIASVVVGAVVWSTHWVFRLRRHDPRSVAWQVTVYLFGVLPGVALALVPAAIGLHAILQWWFGTPAEETASDHFATLPIAVSVALVGIATWAYHRSVLGDEQPDGGARSDPERVYRYLVSAAGLSVVAAGIVAGITLAIDALTPADLIVREEDWWRDQLVLAITLLTVGAPVWAFYWSDVQRSVDRMQSERIALLRRIYLFSIFGVASVTGLVSLTVTLFNFFDALLGEGLTSEVVRDSRWTLALVLTAGVAAVYHWIVLREDQPAYAVAREQRRPTRREVILLAPGDAAEIARQLGALRDVHLRVWRKLPAPAAPAAVTPAQIAALCNEIESSAADCLVVVSDSGDVRVERFEAASDRETTLAGRR